MGDSAGPGQSSGWPQCAGRPDAGGPGRGGSLDSKSNRQPGLEVKPGSLSAAQTRTDAEVTASAGDSTAGIQVQGRTH